MKLEVEVLRTHIQEEMGEINFDITKPFIQVNAFKSTGKWYATKYHPLTEEHLKTINDNRSFEFMELIEQNDSSVREYSPLSTGFSDESIKFAIDVFNCEGFCKRLI